MWILPVKSFSAFISDADRPPSCTFCLNESDAKISNGFRGRKKMKPHQENCCCLKFLQSMTWLLAPPGMGTAVLGMSPLCLAMAALVRICVQAILQTATTTISAASGGNLGLLTESAASIACRFSHPFHPRDPSAPLLQTLMLVLFLPTTRCILWERLVD